MYKASKLINPEGMFTLYHSLFMSYLCYCNEVWGNTYASKVKCIFILQKRVIRLLCGESRLAHTNNLFKERSLLKFPDLVIYKTGIIMFTFLSVYGVKIWNALPEIIKQFPNIHIFKRQLKKCLISSY